MSDLAYFSKVENQRIIVNNMAAKKPNVSIRKIIKLWLLLIAIRYIQQFPAVRGAPVTRIGSELTRESSGESK